MAELSLKDFLMRGMVLRMYRSALKISNRAPVETRAELRRSIREEIEKNRNCKDEEKVRFLISEGRERVKKLDETLDMQGAEPLAEERSGCHG